MKVKNVRSKTQRETVSVDAVHLIDTLTVCCVNRHIGCFSFHTKRWREDRVKFKNENVFEKKSIYYSLSKN